jgi:hypothetical protein
MHTETQSNVTIDPLEISLYCRHSSCLVIGSANCEKHSWAGCDFQAAANLPTTVPTRGHVLGVVLLTPPSKCLRRPHRYPKIATNGTTVEVLFLLR